jgi:hypothetical protein
MKAPCLLKKLIRFELMVIGQQDKVVRNYNFYDRYQLRRKISELSHL